MPGYATSGLSPRIFSGTTQVFISGNLMVGIPTREIMATNREVPDTGIENQQPLASILALFLSPVRPHALTSSIWRCTPLHSRDRLSVLR